MLDAKRECVYSACYSWDEEVLHTLIQPAKRHIEETMRLVAEQSDKLLLVGAVHVQRFAKKYLSNAIAIETDVSYPSPQAFIVLSGYRSEVGVSGTDIFDVVPDYMGEDFTITPSSKVIR